MKIYPQVTYIWSEGDWVAPVGYQSLCMIIDRLLTGYLTTIGRYIIKKIYTWYHSIIGGLSADYLQMSLWLMSDLSQTPE